MTFLPNIINYFQQNWWVRKSEVFEICLHYNQEPLLPNVVDYE